MLKHLRSSRDDRTLWERGFTLVELLVVIVILGILAAVVVFAVGGTEQNAKVKSCLAERNTLEAAVISYQSATDSDPDLIPSPVSPSLMNADADRSLKHTPEVLGRHRRDAEPARRRPADDPLRQTTRTADLRII